MNDMTITGSAVASGLALGAATGLASRSVPGAALGAAGGLALGGLAAWATQAGDRDPNPIEPRIGVSALVGAGVGLGMGYLGVSTSSLSGARSGATYVATAVTGGLAAVAIVNALGNEFKKDA